MVIKKLLCLFGIHKWIEFGIDVDAKEHVFGLATVKKEGGKIPNDSQCPVDKRLCLRCHKRQKMNYIVNKLENF